MNERKKNATFFVSFEEKLIHGKINRKTASILETSGLDRFRLQLRSGLFNAIMPGWQFQHVWKNGKMDQIHTSYKYPPIKRSKFSCCDFNLLYRCCSLSEVGSSTEQLFSPKERHWLSISTRQQLFQTSGGPAQFLSPVR